MEKNLFLIVFALLFAFYIAGCGNASPGNSQTSINEKKAQNGAASTEASDTQKEPPDGASESADNTLGGSEDFFSKLHDGTALEKIKYGALIMQNMSKQDGDIHPVDQCDFQTAIHVDRKDFSTVTEYLEKTTADSERQVAMLMMIQWPFLLGDYATSLRYYEQLQKEYPGCLAMQLLKEDIVRVYQTAYESLQIESLNLPPDEELWRLAVLYYETHMVAWNTSQTIFHDHVYAHKLFDKLLKEYPKSSRADDVEFFILEHSFVDGGDEEYFLEVAEDYQKFVTKYPSSELRPLAITRAAEFYRDYTVSYLLGQQHKPFEEAMVYLNKAKACYERIVAEYKGTEHEKTAQAALQNLNQEIKQLRWQHN